MRLFVPLTKTEFDALRELARIERRRPQDQAAAMLAKVLTSDTPASDQDYTASNDHDPRRDAEEASRVSA